MRSVSSLNKKQYIIQRERRAYVRVELPQRLPFFILNGVKVEEDLELLNVSQGGVGFKSKYRIKPGQVIELFFSIPNSISVSGTYKVVWRGFTDFGYIYGAAAMILSEVSGAVIKTYVKEKTEVMDYVEGVKINK